MLTKRNNSNKEIYDKKVYGRNLVVGKRVLMKNVFSGVERQRTMKFTKQYQYERIYRYTKFKLKKVLVKSKLYTAIYCFCVTNYLQKSLPVGKFFLSNHNHHQRPFVQIPNQTVNQYLSTEGTLKIILSKIAQSQNPKHKQLIVVQEIILILQRKQLERETTESEKATKTGTTKQEIHRILICFELHPSNLRCI